MTLFALMLSTAYEGEMILGIYSSADAATAASEAFVTAHYREGELRGADSFEIRPVELDAAAQHHW
jgi:hypothetical protein